MSVTDRLMGIGAWSLMFTADVPQSVLDTLDLNTVGFGHVIITSTRLNPTGIAEADLLAKASYAGVFRSRPSEFEIGGPGLAFWLGDEEDKGNIFETAKTGGAQTFSGWIGDLRPAALTAGTITAIAGSFVQQFYLTTPRKAIDTVCDYFAGEWKITPDFKLHAGPQANLYNTTTPTVVVQRHENGRDSNITGVDGNLDTALDLEDYTTRAIVVTRGQSGEVGIGASTSGSPLTLFDPQGAALTMKRLIDGSQVDAANGNSVAATEVGRFDEIRRAVTLSANTYDITTDIAVGDTIYVYDPLLGLTDTANEVYYRGRAIHPKKVRVLGYTWPIRRGMGVYFRYYTGGAATYLDLTDWVDYETSDASVEVGASPRMSGTTSTSAQASAPELARLADKSGHKNGTTDANGDITVTYTTAFPTSTDSVVVTVLDGLGGLAVHTQAWSLAAGSFKVRCYTAVGAGSPGYANSGIDFYWRATGH